VLKGTFFPWEKIFFPRNPGKEQGKIPKGEPITQIPPIKEGIPNSLPFPNPKS